MATTPNQPEQKKSGFFLKYDDFKRIEKILEEHNLNNDGKVDFNQMPADEKDVLRKVKMIIHNMEMARLRVNAEEVTQFEEQN